MHTGLSHQIERSPGPHAESSAISGLQQSKQQFLPFGDNTMNQQELHLESTKNSLANNAIR